MGGGLMGRIHRYLAADLWQPVPPTSGAFKAYGVPLLRMIILTARGCRENQIALRASALTLFSLLALVPVAAMVFGIAQGFGFEQRLQALLMSRFAGQEEVLQYVLKFARSLLENTRGGVVAGIGVAALFWAVVKVMGHIESAFNHIWKVPSRTWERRIGDYLAIMLIGPLLLITASSANVYLQTQVTAIVHRVDLLRMVGPAITLAFNLSPYLLIWLLFSLVYIVLPNTRVHFGSGLLAGVLAGTAYQLVQLAYIDLQILVHKYNAIYGSFAALPLFLIWLQLSWLIVLVGAEVARTHQHRRHLSRLGQETTLSHRDQQLIAVRLCRTVVQGFEKGQPAMDADQLADRLDLAQAALQPALDALAANGVLNRVVDAQGEPAGYQPGRDPAHLTLAQVLAALDKGTNDEKGASSGGEPDRSAKALNTFLKAGNNASANILIKEI
ncbi:MAG: YhjD/YihY/BrkB family envelope integrity protein [Desulfosarcinaceae bacterium]|jgi:membrane protein